MRYHKKILLSPEQAADLDERVLHEVSCGATTSSAITENLRAWMRASLPPRDNYTRYVDRTLQRLKYAGKVEARNRRTWLVVPQRKVA